MHYNLQLIYEERKYHYTESFVETHTIYESPFNSYIMYHPTEDKKLNEDICSSIAEVLTPDRRNNINGYVIDITLVNNKLSVDIIDQRNICESLIKLPVDQVKVLAKMIFNKMRKIQIKNRWLAHQDYLSRFYDIVGDRITYEDTLGRSSISVRYVSSSKKMTTIEKKIIEAIRLFMSIHMSDDVSAPLPKGEHCILIELERKSTHPIITGKIYDNLGYFQHVTINLKNIKNRNKVRYILNKLGKAYDFVYYQAEDYYGWGNTTSKGEWKKDGNTTH